jgi:DNA-directed RNA polymerase subunit RPC12/RpoP
MPRPLPPAARRPPRRNGPPRLLAFVFGLAFAGIGLTVAASVWTGQSPTRPPLAGRILVTLIALPFVAAGGSLCATALRRSPGGTPTHLAPPPTDTPGYACPGCGHRLGDQADVSPRGDVKCPYCRRWFNIHTP